MLLSPNALRTIHVGKWLTHYELVKHLASGESFAFMILISGICLKPFGDDHIDLLIKVICVDIVFDYFNGFDDHRAQNNTFLYKRRAMQTKMYKSFPH